MHKKKVSPEYIFRPVSVELADDGFHGSRRLQFTEWWYFDAFFDNGYSIQISVRVLSGLHLAVSIVRYDIYKDSKLVCHKGKLFRLKHVDLSKERPHVSIHGTPVISGSFDPKSKLWTFDINISMQDVSASLRFLGTTAGWKAQHRGGDWWAVIQPKAEVFGSLMIGSEVISVNGYGYHDHNWGVSVGAVKNHGWFWGKIYAVKHTLTWSSLLRTIDDQSCLLVVNTDGGSFVNIPSEAIHFEASDFRVSHTKSIPHQFSLKGIHDLYSINVTMSVQDVHYVRVMMFMHYWRFHVHCIGSITTKQGVEPIDDIFIAEYVRLK